MPHKVAGAKRIIKIRKLDHYSDFEKLVDIQRVVWKHEDAELTPIHQFRISSTMGGILLGAYIGKELAGFVFSFPAVFGKKLCQHSHHLAVLPAYQGLGIGKRLKWAQREWALKLGYDLITWTMDPLQTRNANLNFHGLGARCKTYLPHFYGPMPSLTLAPDLPTDRLLIEWPIRHKKVEMRRRGRFDSHGADKIPKALERKTATSGYLPCRPRLDMTSKNLLVEVPKSMKSWGARPAAISAWQTALRRTLRHYFERGYGIVNFLFSDRCFYVLEKIRRA